MGKNKRKDTVLLKIEGAGNKFETPDKFKTSYYRNQYFQAFKVASDIIFQSQEIRCKKGRPYQNQEIYNIIPFIGARGSGKTSAMLSFAGALKSYHEDEKYNNDLIYRFPERENCPPNVVFDCLDAIDGSLLENGEDIFKVILAQMYGSFMKMDGSVVSKGQNYDYEKRKLQQQFDDVYKSICKLEDDYVEESAITSLRNLSSSLELKKSFENLVCAYLDLLHYENYKNISNQKEESHFLVVIVDDLDLNITQGFDMIEKIHRYLMVPQVIVLIAVDNQQLKRLCVNHFFRMIPKADKLLIEGASEAEELAQDFINKVLPFNVRIYMPAFKKNHNLQIMVNDSMVDMKEGIFGKIYEHVGVRLDHKGEKRHFYEAESLREFVNMYLMLDRMIPLFGVHALSINNKNKEKFLKEYEKNYSIFLSDIRTRMADDKLNMVNWTLFSRLTDANLVRGCRNVVYHMNHIYNDGSDLEKSSLKELSEAIDKYGYSYGELMRTIYCWGRVDARSKEIVKCILALFTAEMTQAYYELRYSDADRKKNVRDEFINILNGSFAGSWANKMFPYLLVRDSSQYVEHAVRIGTVKDVNMGDVFSFTIKADDELVVDNGKLKAKNQSQGQIRLQKIFRTFILFSMLFSSPYQKEQEPFKWKFRNAEYAEINNEMGPTLEEDELLSDAYSGQYIGFKSEDRKGVFNMFNFVSNAFEWECVVQEAQSALYDVLIGDTGKKVDFLSKLEVIKEFEEWQKYSENFVLPFYSLDLTYNLMKRIRQKMQRMQKIVETSEEVYDYYKGILTNIGDMLKKNDSYYGENLEPSSAKTPSHSNLGVIYKNCPYVKWFSDPDKYLIAGFKDEFCGMLKKLSYSAEVEIVSGSEREIRSYDDM